MMSRGTPIAIVLFLAALCIGIISENPRYVFAIAALAVFGFLIVGFFLFPKLKAALPFRLGPVNKGEDDRKLLVAGMEVPPSEYPQHFICVLQLRSVPLLIVLALLSISAFCLLVSNLPLSTVVQHHFFYSLYAAALLTVTALWISTKWYEEQTLLARAGVTLGAVTGINEFPGRRQIRYEFRDVNGGYYGGTERDFFSGRVDNLVFVMYDVNDPDNSASSRGFMFRRFKVYPLKEPIPEG
jgi:uncharacterized membrane protein